MKKILFILIAIVYSYSMQAQEFTIDNIIYKVTEEDEVMVKDNKLSDLFVPINSFTIPSTVTYEGKNYSVTRVGSTALSMIPITNLRIPESVKVIEGAAFVNSPDLQSIEIPASLDSIAVGAFEGCKALKSFKVTQGNMRYKVANGILYSKDGKELVLCPTAKAGTVNIPATVKVIKRGAFSYCKQITGITFPNGLEVIEERGMENCFGLKRVVLPNSMKLIGFRAFKGCATLNSVTMPYDVQCYRQIFHHCHQLQTINCIMSNGQTKVLKADNLK